MNTLHTLRTPETEVVDVAIVGAGFGGLCQAIFLKEAGITNFVILEKGEEVGGTWRDNTYPGCACDVQSHMYSYSFYGKPDWSKRYAPWDEIQGYILDVTEKYGLRPHIRFGCEIDEARFDEKTGTWTRSAQRTARPWSRSIGSSRTARCTSPRSPRSPASTSSRAR
ncbi:MAG: NAD(P)/FAD-dependent oxidoreductase [Polyangiales bacterium]